MPQRHPRWAITALLDFLGVDQTLYADENQAARLRIIDCAIERAGLEVIAEAESITAE